MSNVNKITQSVLLISDVVIYWKRTTEMRHPVHCWYPGGTENHPLITNVENKTVSTKMGDCCQYSLRFKLTSNGKIYTNDSSYCIQATNPMNDLAGQEVKFGRPGGE